MTTTPSKISDKMSIVHVNRDEPDHRPPAEPGGGGGKGFEAAPGLDEPVQRPRAEPSGGGGQQCAAATGNGGCGGGLRGQRLDADEQGQKTKDDRELFLPIIDVR